MSRQLSNMTPSQPPINLQSQNISTIMNNALAKIVPSFVILTISHAEFLHPSPVLGQDQLVLLTPEEYFQNDNALILKNDILNNIFKKGYDDIDSKEFLEHLRISKNQVNEIRKSFIRIQKTYHFDYVEMQKRLEKKCNSKIQDPKSGELHSEFVNLKRKFIQLQIDRAGKSLVGISDQLNPDQFQRLIRSTEFIATKRTLNRIKKSKLQPRSRDYFLMWPCWIAEALKLNRKTIDQLRAIAKQEATNLETDLNRLDDLFLDSPHNKPLTESETLALKNLCSQFRKRVAIRSRMFLNILVSDTSIQHRFQVTEKQKEKLAETLRTPQKQNEKDERFSIRHLNCSLTPNQIVKISRHVSEMVYYDFCLDLPNYYYPLVRSVSENESKQNLTRQLQEIEKFRRHRAKYTDRLTRIKLTKILNSVDPVSRKRIERHLGSPKDCGFRLFQRDSSLSSFRGPKAPRSLPTISSTNGLLPRPEKPERSSEKSRK